MNFSSLTLRASVTGLLFNLLLSGCSMTINHRDLFQLRDTQIPVTSLKLLRPSDAERLSPISLEAKGHTFKGYQFKATNSSRAILFFAGSGYGAPSAMGRVVAAFADEATDIYFLSYGEQYEAAPEIAAVFEMSRKLAKLAETQSGVKPTKITAIGHSFGGWVAMQLAANGEVACSVVLGGASNVIETSYSIVPGFATHFVKFQVTPDVASLDNILLAGRVGIPTLVVGSKADRSTPEDVARRIYASLPPNAQGEIYISDKVAHESYLRDDEVISFVRGFLQRKC